MAEVKVTSIISETTNLTGTIEIEKEGMKQQVMTISCSLSENAVANIQTYVINQQLFLENSQAIVAEVTKFRNKATEVAKPLNCFVF
ncbi:hypothetical protein IZT14_001705 [Clostridium perfringens]|uniref:hypothetical protein n=1 Tax=Clostridium perfringens TaxID=1502 RepID=UPI000D83B699|nr:hypothetical protein [Clostridium perfringens]EGT0683313.1 hypothetical protein [Clostridium perfringens]EGT0685743.1 hypothetical protein [Clostridium perfringens]MDM0892516.1 hypothetical protein [Clostridium perfringens]MDU1966435.1 hypothetical protein [Clostridium perfringens]PWX46145.1 hypothetical protein CYK83_03295 [Clostridium perfringens]